MNTENENIRVGYILTKEGRAISANGIEYATDMANILYKQESPIFWQAGSDLNNPEFMIAAIESRPDAIIIMSNDSIFSIIENYNESAADAMIEALKDESLGDTSWERLDKAIRQDSLNALSEG